MTECDPAARVAEPNVADPATRVDVPIGDCASKIATVPVGTPDPVFGATAMFNVNI